nr:MAG TPA: hypothetical protein [Caudoviricetes sp.]
MLADILGFNIKNPTQVGSLKVDIVKSFEYTYDQDVTEHPVETGFEIADHIVNKPLKLTMTVGIASSPVTWFWKNGYGAKKFANGLQLLEEIRDKKEPVTIVRPEKKYDNMVMTSCRVSKQDSTKSIIYADLSFMQIVKVTTQTTAIPENVVTASQEENAGETAANVGAADTTSVDVSGGSLDISSDSGLDFGGTGETPTNKSWLASCVDNVKSGLGLILGG